MTNHEVATLFRAAADWVARGWCQSALALKDNCALWPHYIRAGVDPDEVCLNGGLITASIRAHLPLGAPTGHVGGWPFNYMAFARWCRDWTGREPVLYNNETGRTAAEVEMLLREYARHLDRSEK